MRPAIIRRAVPFQIEGHQAAPGRLSHPLRLLLSKSTSFHPDVSDLADHQVNDSRLFADRPFFSLYLHTFWQRVRPTDHRGEGGRGSDPAPTAEERTKQGGRADEQERQLFPSGIARNCVLF